MGLRDVLVTFRDTRRRHGVRGTAIVAWAAVDRRRSVSCFHLYGLTHHQPLPKATIDAAREHRMHLAACDEISSGVGRIWAETDIDAARRGDRCLLQWDGSRLVGYTWASVSPLVFIADGLHVNLPEDTAYIYNTYTADEYRGYGFQALRRVRLMELLAPEGKRRLFCYVLRENLNSVSDIRKSGYERVGEIRLARRGGQVRAAIRVTNEFWSDLRRV
jgi:hypothetical protein